MNFQLEFDWIDAGPSADMLARTTMAALSIKADGGVVTSVLDRKNRSYSDRVVTPLFSVAEWLVTNWWHIWHEVDGTNEQRPEFEFRHNLAFAGDGFVLPSLTMTSTADGVRLSWNRYKPRHARIEFVDEGRASVAREELEAAFGDLIDAVIERLYGAGAEAAAKALGERWHAIYALDPEEQEFSRAAALLGVDPFDIDEALADTLVTFWEHVDPSLREDALASATGDSLARVRDWLEHASGLVAAREGDTGQDWREIRRAAGPVSDHRPWARGYALARSVRAQLGAGDGKYEFLEQGPLTIGHQTMQTPSSRILGLVAAELPACITAPKRESGTRFLIARALGDYLGRSEPARGMLCSLAADRHAQSRAFAAEFLVPAAALRRRLGAEAVDGERTDELADEFGVSGWVIRRQVENHELARLASS